MENEYKLINRTIIINSLRYIIYVKESEIPKHPLSIILDDGVNEYQIDNDKNLSKTLDNMIQEV